MPGAAFRITVETPNLTTLRAAVEAGLGLTCRTPLFLPGEEIAPDLPRHCRASRASCKPRALWTSHHRLADLARQTVATL
jgi:DNA-binding transcriptional LysR family regulator